MRRKNIVKHRLHVWTQGYSQNITVDFQMWGEAKTKLRVQFERMLRSILLSSRGVPLHLVFLTDLESAEVIQDIIHHEVGRYLSESIIRITPISNAKHVLKFPRLVVEFVELSSITAKHQQEIAELRRSLRNLSQRPIVACSGSPSSWPKTFLPMS